MKSKLLIAALTVAVLAFFSTCDNPVGGRSGDDGGEFEFTRYGEGYEVTGFSGTARVVIIPATHNGLPVTSIGCEAFHGSQLTSVSIPTNCMRAWKLLLSVYASRQFPPSGLA